MFIGEYHHTIDEKGRIIIPSKFREELGSVFVVTRGIENCLFVYSMNNWNEICDKLNTLPFTKKDARNFIRFFMSGATTVELDKQGRINIPQTLREYAQLEKACHVIGVSERIEIWSETRWNQVSNDAEEMFDSIAEDMIDFGF